jgi:RimJ/RimL family protein N-acetyltransferase
MVYRTNADEARPYFDHPSQRKGGMVDPANLHDDGIEYLIHMGGVCGAFHAAQWPGVWMAHYGMQPRAWGFAVGPALDILRTFWMAKQPERIIGWTKESNRAALAFAKRLGFEIDGRMDLPSGPVILQGWRL